MNYCNYNFAVHNGLKHKRTYTCVVMNGLCAKLQISKSLKKIPVYILNIYLNKASNKKNIPHVFP